MKKHKYIIGIIILSSVLFCFCQKKLVKYVELHGRVFNLGTNLPKKAILTLQSDDVHGNGITTLSKILCHDDGTFHLTTFASNGQNYYLLVNYNNGQYRRKIFLRENDKTNLDVPVGDHTYYCKVTLIPISNSAIDFYDDSGPLHFNAGTSTQFIYKKTLSADYYEATYHKFYIDWKTYPSGISTYTYAEIPLNSPDTLNLTVNY